MAEKKMTKKEYFAKVSAIVAAADVEDKSDILNFIAHEIDLLDRKSGKSGMSKTQKENLAVVDFLRDAMKRIGHAVTVKELLADDEVANYRLVNGEPLSSQKVTALLTGMVKRDEVVRTEEKKVAYFSIKE